ncbi:MAG TPA: hypothetical protein VKB88_25735 [Bryobacteraceae bacterium]|nr:hypothetical protein [Bryobacteraceae bacterium]
MKLRWLAAAALPLLLTSCSQQPSAPPEKKVEAKPEPVTGQSALFKMYQVARAWAPDCQVLKLTSMRIADVPDQPGKAGVWEATFVSPSRSEARTYNWSAVDSVESNLHKGVFQTNAQPFSAHGSSKPFLIAAVKTDTDAALETAKAKAVEYEKKNPGKPILFLLEQTSKFPDPAWRVVWGESVGTSNFSVYVDAMTGGYLATMH